MPDVKISALPASTTPLAGTEVLPIVQSATTRQVSVANLTAGRSVSGTNFIPSGSSVPTNGLYLPAANSLGFSTNSTNVVTIDAAGNLGLGVTPSAWTTSFGIKGFNISNGALYGSNNDMSVLFNSYFNGTNFIYSTTAVATRYTQGPSGQHQWFNAPSGTAGNTISFTQAMTLDASGNLGIGISSPTAVIDVLGSYFNGGSSRTNTATKTFGFRVPHCFTATNPMNVIGGLSTTSVNNVYIGGSDSNIGGTAATDLYFYTAANNTTADGTLRMRIDASGIVTMSAYGAGAATFSASGVISSVSDETWKTKDGVPTNPDVMLQNLEPGYWFYNEEKAPIFGQDRQLGFYAQNVHEAIGAEAAPTPEEGKPWGYYDRSVLAITVMSLKNALNTIEELKQRITALENK